MTTTNYRGTLIEVNGALNRPTTKFGIDYRLLGLCLLTSVPVFLWGSKLAAVTLAPFLVGGGAWLTKKDSQMPALWLLSFRLKSYYDPGK